MHGTNRGETRHRPWHQVSTPSLATGGSEFAGLSEDEVYHGIISGTPQHIGIMSLGYYPDIGRRGGGRPTGRVRRRLRRQRHRPRTCGRSLRARVLPPTQAMQILNRGTIGMASGGHLIDFPRFAF